MVIKLCERLPTVQIRDLVQGLYGMHATAAVRLSDHLVDTCGCHKHIADCLISGWVRKTSPSIQGMASDCGIPYHQAQREHDRAMGTLRGWDRMATEMLRVWMEARGWI